MKFLLFISLSTFLLLVTGCSQNNDYGYSQTEGYEDCVEPENPYGDGGGHDAGRQRGEAGNDCGGNSSSFIEGCEEYQEAFEVYQNCLHG